MRRFRKIIRECITQILLEKQYWGIGGAGIILVCSEDNTVFLQKRAKWVTGGAGQWSFPGGGIHPEGSIERHYETPIDPDKRLSLSSSKFLNTAKREFKEEVGWIPSFKILDIYVSEDDGFIFKTFIGDCPVNEKKNYSSRSHEAENHRWVTIEEFNHMAQNNLLWDVSFNKTVVSKVNNAF